MGGLPQTSAQELFIQTFRHPALASGAKEFGPQNVRGAVMLLGERLLLKSSSPLAALFHRSALAAFSAARAERLAFRWVLDSSIFLLM